MVGVYTAGKMGGRVFWDEGTAFAIAQMQGKKANLGMVKLLVWLQALV